MSSQGVEYLVVGGIACVLHGVPRLTRDLDLLIRPTRENAERLLRAFLDSGLGTAALITPEGLLANEITIFKDRFRVDVQTRTPGVDFDEAWTKREVMTVAGAPVPVLSVEDLLRSKEAAGRPVDRMDAEYLRRLPKGRPPGT